MNKKMYTAEELIQLNELLGKMLDCEQFDFYDLELQQSLMEIKKLIQIEVDNLF